MRYHSLITVAGNAAAGHAKVGDMALSQPGSLPGTRLAGRQTPPSNALKAPYNEMQGPQDGCNHGCVRQDPCRRPVLGRPERPRRPSGGKSGATGLL